MNLLLMRHGDAEYPVTTDQARRLTPLGHQQVRRTAKNLRDLAMKVDAVITSPYVRAEETARIMMSGSNLILQTSDRITPEGDPGRAAEVLVDAVGSHDTLLAVMHQPIISRLILYLTDIEQPMGTANLAVIEGSEIERGCCTLRCVI